MSTFVTSGTQMVIGSRDLPKKVITGPRRFWRWRQRIHCQVSTVPKWSTFIFEEIITVTQTPVTLGINCNWARNLANLPTERLTSAVGVSNEALEAMLRKNLGIIAQSYVSYHRVSDLVGGLEITDQQLITIQQHRRRLANTLKGEMKQRLGGLGLVINQLEVNLTFPARLQQDIEDLWHLQKLQLNLSDFQTLKLAQTMAKSQTTINMLVGLPSIPTTTNRLEPIIETLPIPTLVKTNQNGHSKTET